MRYKTKLRKVKMRHVSKRNKYIKCPVPMSWEALQSIRDLVTLKCELLGAVPARGHVRRYCFPGTDVLDVSHVGNRKNLENSTRDYSGRCSYASPFFSLAVSDLVRKSLLTVKKMLERGKNISCSLPNRADYKSERSGRKKTFEFFQ